MYRSLGATPSPLLVIFTVSVVDVFRTCDPKPRLAGVALSTTDEGVVGVGVGLAPGFGELLLNVALPAPPHPIMAEAKSIGTRKAPIFVVKFVVLRTITPHSQNFKTLISVSANECLPSLHHFRQLRLK